MESKCCDSKGTVQAALCGGTVFALVIFIGEYWKKQTLSTLGPAIAGGIAFGVAFFFIGSKFLPRKAKCGSEKTDSKEYDQGA